MVSFTSQPLINTVQLFIIIEKLKLQLGLHLTNSPQ